MSTKDRILETAIDLFSRKGYSGVSIRDITREIGIKESTLYYHFNNKEEILHSIFALFQEGYQNIFPPAGMLDPILSSTTPGAFLKQGIDNYKKMIADHPSMSKIARIIHMEQFGHPRARQIILQNIFKQSLDFLENVFAKMIEARLIRSYPPRLLAREYQYPVFAMFMEYQILTFDNEDTSELDKRLYEHVSFFIDHIQVQKG